MPYSTSASSYSFVFDESEADYISDPKLRAKYIKWRRHNEAIDRRHQHHNELLDLRRDFYPIAERALVEYYSQPPFATAELERLVNDTHIDPDLAGRILSKVRIISKGSDNI